MIDLEVSSEGLQQIQLDLAATEAQAIKALNSTLTKMAAWLRSKSVKGLSAELQIQQKVLRRRLRAFRISRHPNGGQITVWYGLDPIALIYLGARQTRAGVSAMGGRFVQSGFIAPTQGGRQVFKRRGKARLPIDKQRAEIEDKANTYIEDQLLGTEEFEARFFTIFERELTWRTQ
jgi:hypothetical protein